ncbi:hypothetical protein D9M68_760780 [compost metagenome]
MHVDDVVSALLLCGFNPNAKGNIFNISNDCLQEELVCAIAKVVGGSAPWVRIPESVARGAGRAFSRWPAFPLTQSRIDALVRRTRYPTDKIESYMGFRPQRDIISTIAEVFQG